MSRAGLMFLGLALALVGRAASAPAVSGPPAASHPAWGDDELLLEEVFQSHLPATLEKFGLRLSVHPHLGDWQKKDRMRVTTRLRYGLTENCEISADSNLYFSHGHGEIRAFDDYGAANLKLGVKFDLGQRLFRGWEHGAGVDYEFPTGHPPAELTDGLRHLRPYVTFSHRLAARPRVRIFVGLRGDYVTTTTLPGEFGTNAFRESSAGITGGWVVDRDNWRYTLEASYDTTRLTGDTAVDITSLRPGVIWEIPTRRDRRQLSHWMAGVSLNATHGPGGTSLGASFKLRYNRDIKTRVHRSMAP